MDTEDSDDTVENTVNLQSRDQREEYLNTLRGNVSQLSYPNCDPVLAKHLLRAQYVAEEAESQGFEEYSESIMNLVGEALSPLEEYRQITEENIDQTSDEALLASLCVHTWYEIMGSFADYNGENVKLGDLVNMIFEAEDVDEAVTILTDLTEFVDGKLEDIDIDSDDIYSDPVFGDSLEKLETDISGMFKYFVVLMSYHRVYHDEPLDDREMRIP